MNEPLKAYKFRVKFTGSADSGEIGVMSVSGLRYGTTPGELVLIRGVIPGHEELLRWFGDERLRDLSITVDDHFAFQVRGARPVYLKYSDLDAGAEAKYILLEHLRVHYSRLIPEFV